jgi:16S rRNA (adenine1518-N6/adenine1519-N6)-dimethyltransferase
MDSQLTIKQIIDKYGLLNDAVRSKSLGQHFLCDLSLLRKIVAFAQLDGIIDGPLDGTFDGNSDCDIVEIGPGATGLTRAIIEKLPGNSHLFCIEKDIRMRPVHENLAVCYDEHIKSRLHFIYANALDVELHKLTDKKIILISNLPYNVSTKLLTNWLHYDISSINSMILMFQKEVAARITARLSTKEYGRLSVIAQTLCNYERLFDISNMAFYPPPKVLSTVLRLKPKKNIDKSINLEHLERITNVCFQKRRKTMFSILKSKCSDVENLLTKCGIDKNDRPENVSFEKFIALSEIYAAFS